MEIKTICDALLSGLEEASYNESTILNYKGVVRRFIRLLNSYYITGSFNFDTLKHGKGEPSNCKHAQIYNVYSLFLQTNYSKENTIHFYEYELYSFLQYLDKFMVYNVEKLTPHIVVNYLKFAKQNRQREALCGLRLFLKYIKRNDLFVCIEGIHDSGQKQ